MLDNLPPAQRQLVLYGAPVVAAYVLITKLRGNSAPAAPAPDTTPTLPDPSSTGDAGALGSDQLAAFGDNVLAALAQLEQLLNQSPTAPAPVTAPPKPRTIAARRHRVVHGDSLSNIALRDYGSGSLWPIIYNANRALIGPNPQRLPMGAVLTIPAVRLP